MADFALWATACETALWPVGAFWSAYCGNRDEAVEGVIDADPIAAAVRAMMSADGRTEWTGTASDLLGALGEMAGERVAKSKTWPDSPRALAARLRRAATFLRKIGIDIRFRARRTGADADHPHHRYRATDCTRNRGGPTLRTVRVVLIFAERQSAQRFRRARHADGRGSRGRIERRHQSNRPRQRHEKPRMRPMRTVRTQISGPILRGRTQAGGPRYERGSGPNGGPRRRHSAWDRWGLDRS